MSYFKNKKAYSTTCGWKTDYRNNDEKYVTQGTTS